VAFKSHKELITDNTDYPDVSVSEPASAVAEPG